MLFLPWQFVELILKLFYTGNLIFTANVCINMGLELHLITSSLLGLEGPNQFGMANSQTLSLKGAVILLFCIHVLILSPANSPFTAFHTLIISLNFLKNAFQFTTTRYMQPRLWIKLSEVQLLGSSMWHISIRCWRQQLKAVTVIIAVPFSSNNSYFLFRIYIPTYFTENILLVFEWQTPQVSRGTSVKGWN